MSKQNAIMCDLHGTLLNKDGTLNKELYNLLQSISNQYYICIVTASYYPELQKMRKDIDAIDKLDVISQHFYYNNNPDEKDDATIKKHIYTHQIKSKFKVAFLVDNNKSCIKEFKELGIDTLRYKPGE